MNDDFGFCVWGINKQKIDTADTWISYIKLAMGEKRSCKVNDYNIQKLLLSFINADCKTQFHREL